MSISLENEGYHGDRDLVDIPESGEPIFDEPLDADTQFARTLHRIWQEKGDFSQVSSKSLLEDQLNEISDVEKQSEPEEETRKDEALSVDDVLKLKQSVLTNLGDAKNELAVALDVVNLLLSNTPRHENAEMQLPIPKHSLGTASIDISEPTPFQSLKKSKIAITTKNESLQSAANIFDRASDQTEQINAQNTQFWQECLLLHDNSWTLIPSNGRADSTNDLEKAAKDLKVLYSVDEASNEIKIVSNASFDVKASQSNDSNLKIPKKRSKRLKLSIGNGSYTETSSPFRSNDDIRTSLNENERIDSILRSLKDAQDASFEEDLFASLLTEVNHLPIVITSSAEIIAIELDAMSHLVLELVNEDDYLKEGEHISSKCNALLLGIKLLQIRSYKNKSASTNQVLKQILDLLHYEAFTENIRVLFGRITALLSYLEVKEAAYHVQKTNAREILEIFLNHHKPQTVGSQGHLNFGKHNTTNISLSSPHTVFVQLANGLQRTTISQLKTLTYSNALTATLNALHVLCSNLSNTRVWWVDGIERCLIGRRSDKQISIHPVITETRCDISLRSNSNNTSNFSVDYEILDNNAALKDWLVRHID